MSEKQIERLEWALQDFIEECTISVIRTHYGKYGQECNVSQFIVDLIDEDQTRDFDYFVAQIETLMVCEIDEMDDPDQEYLDVTVSLLNRFIRNYIWERYYIDKRELEEEREQKFEDPTPLKPEEEVPKSAPNPFGFETFSEWMANHTKEERDKMAEEAKNKYDASEHRCNDTKCSECTNWDTDEKREKYMNMTVDDVIKNLRNDDLRHEMAKYISNKTKCNMKNAEWLAFQLGSMCRVQLIERAKPIIKRIISGKINFAFFGVDADSISIESDMKNTYCADTHKPVVLEDYIRFVASYYPIMHNNKCTKFYATYTYDYSFDKWNFEIKSVEYR
jgi:hypothetical protein